MATPLVFKMGTGAITNPTPGTYYISKTEKDGTYKWNIQIADDNGALYDILTPDNVKGLEYTDDDNKVITVTAEDFKQLEQDLLDLEKKFNDQTTDFNNNLMPLSGGTFIGDVTFGEADDLDVVSNATFNNNVTFNQVPVIIKSIGEDDATAYEVATLVEVENVVNNSADEVNKTITNFKAEYNDYVNANNTNVNNKINKANDTFTGQTDFGTNTQGIITNFYGTQNFNGTTNFAKAPKIGTETITTVEYVDPKFTTINTTLSGHAGSIGDIQNLLGEVQQSVPYLNSPNTFTKLNTFDGSTTFDGTVEFNNQVEFKNTVTTDAAVTLKGATKIIGTIEVPTPTENTQAATKGYVDDLRNTATDASNQLQTNKAGRAEINEFTKSNTFNGGVTITGEELKVESSATFTNLVNMTQLPLITEQNNYTATLSNELITKHHIDTVQTNLQKNIDDVSEIAVDAKAKIDAFLLEADSTATAVDTLKEIQAELDKGTVNAASLAAEIENIKNTDVNKNIIVYSAKRDAMGNIINTTYATKSALADDTANLTTAINNVISTAAADATTKANTAESNANTYTNNKITTLTGTTTSSWDSSAPTLWGLHNLTKTNEGLIAKKFDDYATIEYVNNAINTLQDDLAVELGTLL